LVGFRKDLSQLPVGLVEVVRGFSRWASTSAVVEICPASKLAGNEVRSLLEAGWGVRSANFELAW
jgi:hypothetical protein